MPPVLEKSLLDRCALRFAEEPKLVAVWIFGSALAERLRDDSDIDLALYYQPGGRPDCAALADLAMDLEDVFQRRVDLGLLGSRNLIYAAQAVRTGRLIYAPDEAAAIALSSRILTLYLDLKRDRKPVEEAYCA